MNWYDYNNPWVCPICGWQEVTAHHGYIHLVEAHPLPSLPVSDGGSET